MASHFLSKTAGITRTELYQRHKPGCKSKHCQCPWWVYGYIAGVRIRESLKTGDMATALERQRFREQGPATDPAPPSAPLAPSSPQRGHASPFTSPAAKNPYTENSLADLIEAFIDYRKAWKSLVDSTVVQYRYTLGRFRDYADRHGVSTYEALTPVLVENFISAGQLSDSTRRKYYVNLKTFTKFARKRSSLKDDLLPEELPGNPGGLEGSHRPLTKAEQCRILAACDRSKPHYRARDRAIILVLLSTGLRSVDVRQLAWVHLDATTQTLRKRMQKTRRSRTTNLVISGLPQEMFEALRALPRSTDPAEPIFRSRRGRPLDTQQFADIVMAILKRAEVDATPHDFRVTCGVEWLLAGDSLAYVSKLLGHSSTLVTERCYIKWVPDLDRRLEEVVRKRDFSHLAKAS